MDRNSVEIINLALLADLAVELKLKVSDTSARMSQLFGSSSG